MMEKNKKMIIALGVIAVLLLIIVLLLIFMNKTYTVTFDSKGGTEVASQVVKRNGVVAEPKDPIKEGYTFLGWYLDEESDIKYDFGTKVEKDITLIAKWGEIKKEITELSIMTEKEELTIDEELSLTLKIMSGEEELEVEGLEVIWASSDETIATVDQTGKVKALKAGTVTITVTVNGVESEIKLTIKSKKEETSSNSNTNTTSNNTSSGSTSTGSNSKPSTGNNNKPNNNTNTENNNTQTEVTYTYQWEKVDSSVAGQYMLYIVSSEGKKVSGTATITTIAGTQTTVSIPASGQMYVKDAIASVSNVKVAN